jgi:hypothetical protein
LARGSFDVVDVTEILVHWRAGRSHSEIATSLGVDRKTVKKYVAPAIEAGLVPGGPAKPVAEWEELVRNWFPEMADTRLRQTAWPEIDSTATTSWRCWPRGCPRRRSGSGCATSTA